MQVAKPLEEVGSFFAVSAPGLEPYTYQELRRLGLASEKPGAGGRKQPKPGPKEDGGVEFSGRWTDLYRSNLHLRTASRVLVRLGEFYAAAFPELRRKAARLPWHLYLAPGQGVALRVTCIKSRLYHSGAVAERIAGAIEDHLGKPPVISKFDEGEAEENLPQLVIVRIVQDLCTISIDSSGSLLHRRGYRLETARAPLRETLAAGMLMASGWNRKTPLVDPFCGSGTIAIEAALMARQVPPGHNRRFAFMDWPSYNEQTWKDVLQEKPGDAPAPAPILASDRDAGAVKASRANAERAGVLEDIEFACQTVSAMEPPGDMGWVVTNPPYGLRTSPNKDLRNLYAQFGNILNTKFEGWNVAVLSTDVRLLNSIRVRFERGVTLVNGGVRVKLAIGRIEKPGG